MIELDNNFYIIFITFLLSFLIGHVFRKKNILIDQVTYSKHKKLKNKAFVGFSQVKNG